MSLRIANFDSSLSKFTNDLLTEGVFNCAACAKLLKTPVFTVKGLGNVCCKCVPQDQKDVAVEASTLTDILTRLKIPCKFRTAGCENTVLYSELDDHEKKCLCRNVKCLMSGNQCQWVGTLSNVLSHFKSSHPQDVTNFSSEPFSLKFPIVDETSEINFIKLLTSTKVSFFLHAAKTKDEKDLNLVFYMVTNDECRQEIAVQYIGTYEKYEVICSALPLRLVYNDNPKVKLKTLILNEISRGVSTTMLMKMSRNAKQVPQEVFECMECPICYRVMSSAIYQCINGHSICDLCRTRVSSCPMCRAQTYTNMRNYSLEKLISKIRNSKVTPAS